MRFFRKSEAVWNFRIFHPPRLDLVIPFSAALTENKAMDAIPADYPIYQIVLGLPTRASASALGGKRRNCDNYTNREAMQSL